MKLLVSCVVGVCVGYCAPSMYAAIAAALMCVVLYVVEHVKHKAYVSDRTSTYRCTVTYTQVKRNMPCTAEYYGQDRRTTPTYQYK